MRFSNKFVIVTGCQPEGNTTKAQRCRASCIYGKIRSSSSKIPDGVTQTLKVRTKISQTSGKVTKAK